MDDKDPSLKAHFRQRQYNSERPKEGKILAYLMKGSQGD
jgi:hypothetical protein